MPRHSTPDRGALQGHSGSWASQTRILRDRAPLIRVSLLRPLLAKMHFGILNPARDWYVILETGAARAVLSARRGRFCTAPVRVWSLDFPDSSFLARFWPEEFGLGGDFVVQTLRSLLRGFRTGSGIWVFGFGFGLGWIGRFRVCIGFGCVLFPIRMLHIDGGFGLSRWSGCPSCKGWFRFLGDRTFERGWLVRLRPVTERPKSETLKALKPK